MFELEALLLGLEPMTAAVIGVGALAIAPIVGAVDAATGSNLSDSARSTAKTGLVWVFQAFDKVQSSAAEASESFQDLIAEAKSDIKSSKNGTSEVAPREVTIG
ncbi:DUF5132 domain-containing protein [Nostoc sphaeroides]|uniref:DUF5132 domain-containing protein n=1 Tax=Nostoc sphaeroides CCNUC1 TaxID=2653204 RepID=A0A5P8WF45_9NOSO|nr:DUF5132 domain-containing protein [Nostoc sphaeroides]MCC5632432.1 DUF5132 domain-containing protein [Nostoc sphaeroides CHAB 2801]QFS50469.1 hypothetical protein GXM_07963 [Nostoc sphaeroides CCNUC1]